MCEDFAWQIQDEYSTIHFFHSVIEICTKRKYNQWFETFYGIIKLFKKWNKRVTESLLVECYGPDIECDSANPCIIWQEDASFKEQSCDINSAVWGKLYFCCSFIPVGGLLFS